jgi:hypothetical protein
LTSWTPLKPPFKSNQHTNKKEDTMSKHTPEPWYADGRGVIWGADTGTPTGRMAIAQCRPNHRAHNARLIAAAPELLEAAAHAARILEYYLRDMSAGEKESLKFIRAAIAKATGE